MASNSQDKLFNHISELRNRGFKFNGTPVYNVTKADIQKLQELCDKYGIPLEWMANLMNLESGLTFNPAVKNPSSGATGLIQFMPSTARGLNTTTDALSKLSFQEQLVYVDKFLIGNLKRHLDENGKVKPSFTQQDLFMTIFYPVSIGKPDYIFPDNVAAQNGGIRTPKDYTKGVLKPKKNPPNPDIPPPFPDAPFELDAAVKKYKSGSSESEKNNLTKTLFLVALITVAGYVLLTETKQGNKILALLK